MPTLSTGDLAPDFTLASDGGAPVTLSSLRGRPVILYFYPKDDTPGCTVQACEVRDGAAQIAAAGVVVLGISRDSLASHARFRTKFGLNFPLLSDPDLAVHTLFGAYGEKTMYGKKVQGVIRSTAVLDAAGRILSLRHGVKSKGHLERTLALLGA